MSEPVAIGYFLLFFTFGLVLCFRLFGWTRLERIFARVALVGNGLLLSSIWFSEYAGILWCLNGWGDFWRWNYGFLSSTFIMLYLMLVFHLPGKGLVSQRMHSITGAMNSLVFLGITVSRSAP